MASGSEAVDFLAEYPASSTRRSSSSKPWRSARAITGGLASSTKDRSAAGRTSSSRAPRRSPGSGRQRMEEKRINMSGARCGSSAIRCRTRRRQASPPRHPRARRSDVDPRRRGDGDRGDGVVTHGDFGRRRLNPASRWVPGVVGGADYFDRPAPCACPRSRAAPSRSPRCSSRASTSPRSSRRRWNSSDAGAIRARRRRAEKWLAAKEARGGEPRGVDRSGRDGHRGRGARGPRRGAAQEPARVLRLGLGRRRRRQATARSTHVGPQRQTIAPAFSPTEGREGFRREGRGEGERPSRRRMAVSPRRVRPALGLAPGRALVRGRFQPVRR